jgi:hypothetical protein
LWRLPKASHLHQSLTGPRVAFEGTGGSLAGAFLHKQFMQDRPSWRHAMTAGTRGARASPRCGERVPFFYFDFQKRGRTPTSKRALKPAVVVPASPAAHKFAEYLARRMLPSTPARLHHGTDQHLSYGCKSAAYSARRIFFVRATPRTFEVSIWFSLEARGFDNR